MLRALMNTGISENTNTVGETSIQIAQRALERERALGDELTNLRGQRQALVGQLNLSPTEEERAQLTSRLNALEEEIDVTYNSAFGEVKKLNKIIEKNNQIELSLMLEEMSRFERVEVLFESSTDFPQLPPIIRTMKPVLFFSELQALVENLYPGFNVVLMKPGTVNMVGSQEELFFAYQDVSEGKVLYLELKISSASLKRKRKADDEGESIPEVRHEGPWSNAEIELFKMGVDQFGWTKWQSISGIIGTRDRQQVRQFASTPKGLSFKKTLSITQGLLDLAEGMKIVAQIFQGMVTEHSEQGEDLEDC